MVYILKKSNIIIENGIKKKKQGNSMQTCDRYNECSVARKCSNIIIK